LFSIQFADAAQVGRDSTDHEVQIRQLMISKTVNLTLQLARKKRKGQTFLCLSLLVVLSCKSCCKSQLQIICCNS
jgi:hypothetical protein